MTDASLWGAVWAIFAAAAGISLTVAARTLWRRTIDGYYMELDAGHNLLAPQLDR